MTLMRSRTPSLSELQAFECAARLGSFTRAAEELRLTQGAVSRQIRSLEDTLGTAVFERTRRQVLLTEVGRVYLAEVRKALVTLERAGERVSLYGADSVLNLAVLPTFATRWLIPRLPRFLAGQAGLTINLAVRLEPFPFDRDPFDAAIHFGDPPWTGADLQFLCRERLVAVASPELAQRLALGSPATLERAVLLHQTTRPRAWRDWFAHQHATHPGAERGPRMDQFAMITEAAVAGLGAALLPRFLIEEELTAGRLLELPAMPFESRQAYWLAIPEHKQGEPLVQALRDWLVAEVSLPVQLGGQHDR